MTGSFVYLRRISALSVAITLFAAPIASAQTPAPASTSDAPANTVLLGPTAFARLVQPPPADVAPVPVVADSLTRASLLRQGTAAIARQAQAAPAKAPQQKGWVARHKTITGLLIGAGAFLGWVATCATVGVVCGA